MELCGIPYARYASMDETKNLSNKDTPTDISLEGIGFTSFTFTYMHNQGIVDIDPKC